MSTELAYEASDEASESELLERSLSVWKGLTSVDLEDFAPTTLDIHTACSVGHNEWVRSIILKGGDPGLDRRNRGGWTPLMYACYIGHDNIVNLLISAGCNMNMKNSKGHTPLMLAASCGNESVARTLVRKGAELELMDKTGWTALFHATYAGHQNFVAFLLEAGANKDAVEPSSGTTPFMEASAEGHEIIVQLLLQHGVSVNAKAHNGYMARSLALMNGHMKVVSLIDNNILPSSCLRSEAGLNIYLSSSEEARPQRQHPPSHNKRLKSKGPSIRDGPEAIARMIDRTRHTEPVLYTNLLVPKGYVSFPVGGADKEDTKMSYRDVTSPINPEDYKDSSDSRAMSDLDDFNDDSNAFTKTGAITIKSSSSSSGGLVAALGLSRESSLDSDDSHSYDQAGTSSDDVHEGAKLKGESVRATNSVAGGDRPTGQNLPTEHWIIPSNEINQISSIKSIRNHPSSIEISNNHSTFAHNPGGDTEKAESNIKQDNGVVSPLRDYFPLDSSFPVETSAPASSVCKVSNGKPWLPPHQSSPTSSCEHALPRDNMTQVEIVNRFLKNLTVNNPETSAGQNRWADEVSDQSANDDELSDASLYPLHIEGFNATTPDYEQNNNSIKRLFLSNRADCKEVEQQNSDNILNRNPISNKANIFQKDVFELSGDHQTEADRRIPKTSSCTKLPANFQPQTSHCQRLNRSGNQKDPHEHSPTQPWSQHPRRHHHHPLSNRNHHNNSLSNRPDSSLNGIRQTPPKTITSSHTPDTNPPEMPPSITHNIPRNYYYSGIESAPNFHQQYLGQTSEATVHPPVQIISQFGINSKLDISPNLLFNHANPSTSSSGLDLYDNVEALICESVSPASQRTRISNQHTAGPHNINQAEYKPQDSNCTQLPVQSTKSHQFQSPDNLSHSSSVQDTVIIPGHVKSQPVCSTIDWGLAGQSENHGPRDLAEMLTQLSLTKYLDKFVEQDVDLQVFLSMTDNDLKELGVKLFGPRKKMTNAIARWHSNAPIASNSLELAYADKLEGEMQELAIQLNQACGNEERLKAQVLQEQQLRSVTESCLMEERTNWEQARQILLSTKTKLRTVGDLTSRLRLCHRELRKHFEDVSKQLLKENSESDARQVSPTAAKSLGRSGESCVAVAEAGGESGKGADNVVTTFCADSGDLLKRSEKYFKEMQQTLNSVVAGMDHLLKSTTTVSNIDKLRPQT